MDLGNATFVAQLLPAMHTTLVASDPGVKLTATHRVGYQAIFPERGSGIMWPTTTQTKPADAPASLPADFKPSSRPRVVAAAPTDADFSRAATYSITLPKSAFTDTPTVPPTEQYFLRIIYNGDVARLSAPIDGKSQLLDDNFTDGRPWFVGLTRFDPKLTQSGGKLDISIYPLRPNPPIFFEPEFQPRPDNPPARLIDVALVTQYTLKLKLVPQAPHK